MKRNGFTIIELVIVIALMGILLTIGVVNMTSSEISARDSERKGDIDTISTYLETFYSSGTDGVAATNGYPSTANMIDLATQQTTLRDIDSKNLIAPLAPNLTITSLTVATNNVQTTAGVLPLPQATNNQNQYVYQPIQSDGSLCTTGLACRRYNLYYMTEADSVVHMIKSKNR